MEAELLAEDEFDPREGGPLPKSGAVGAAGKPRPIHRGNSKGKLEIRAPPPGVWSIATDTFVFCFWQAFCWDLLRASIIVAFLTEGL